MDFRGIFFKNGRCHVSTIFRNGWQKAIYNNRLEECCSSVKFLEISRKVFLNSETAFPLSSVVRLDENFFTQKFSYENMDSSSMNVLLASF